MRISRFLLPGCVLALWAGPLLAQPGLVTGSPEGLIPSMRPVAGEPDSFPVPQPTRSGVPRMPTNRPVAAVANLEEMTTAQPPQPQGDPLATLTTAPAQFATGLPPGSYPSPYYTDGPGCCGPLGRNGQIGYEVYTYSGVNIPFGDGLAARMNAGWTIGGGTRTLFFTQSHTAAWVVDLGLSYTHNWAAGDHDPATLFIRQTRGDRVALSAVREVHRSSFNFAFGRDVWLMGAGNNTGAVHGTNVRVGAWVGGRWGSSHVDLIPLDEVGGYARRQNVFEGVVVGSHLTFERPLGGWILFGGGRIEYGYDWTNLIPPLQGNINNVNLQLSLGVRY
jgi:hypothetical protein